MKLAAGEAARVLARPDPRRAGLLLYGADPMRVALKRQAAVAAMIGPEGEAEMRLTRIAAADLRRDPAQLDDALRGQGFFPGPRVALVEEAGDALAPLIGAALADWREGDASIVVTAGALAAKSALRKLFEDSRAALSLGIYDDPPGRDEIEATLRAAGLSGIGDAAMGDILDLARMLEPGDFRQTVEKIALYKWGDDSALSAAEVALCAPASTEADVDDVINVVAEAQAGRIGPLIARLQAQGLTPVALCIGALRHFRALHAAATHPEGAATGLARARPPVFGPRRDRMLRQLRGWTLPRLEQALSMLIETDLTLRSSSRAPQMAVVERALIRLAMLPKR